MNWSNKWGDDEPNLSNLNWSSDNPIPNVNKATPIEIKQPWIITKQLTLTNGNKQYIFTAEIIGDLALDFTPEGQPNAGWNIYHVPTLTCFSKAVPPIHADLCAAKFGDKCDCKGFEWAYEYSCEALLTWMAKVQKNWRESKDVWPVEIEHAWYTLRLLTPDNYSDNGQSAKDIILKWCLSVPVVEE